MLEVLGALFLPEFSWIIILNLFLLSNFEHVEVFSK
jgi:hypothetical protein